MVLAALYGQVQGLGASDSTPRLRLDGRLSPEVEKCLSELGHAAVGHLQAVPGSVAPSERSGSLFVSILEPYQETLPTRAGLLSTKISDEPAASS